MGLYDKQENKKVLVKPNMFKYILITDDDCLKLVFHHNFRPEQALC